MSETELKCPQVRVLLEAHFEGTLPSRRQQQVAAHLRRCQACTAQRQQIERTAAALAAVPRAEPGIELLRAISARTAALPAPDARRALTTGWVRLGWVAAACVAMLATLNWMLPLIWQRGAVMVVPAFTWLKTTAIAATPWMASAGHVMRAVLTAVQEIARALGLAGAAAAPTIGLYAAAEVGLIAAVLFVFHWGRRKAHPRLMGIVV